ncbi:MAG TPA: DUF6531 domain-containing protein [Solirubrobacteraceae bacterium]|jgi:YD repeat-containing protein|nr:DUF6531 domain-containing protein [Solirubrobacteraceae bacterium]
MLIAVVVAVAGFAPAAAGAVGDPRGPDRPHRSLSSEQALAVAEHEHGDSIGRPPWRSLRLRAGERVERYLTAHTALVDRGAGRRDAVATSALPLQVRDAEGILRPVDLMLERDGVAYAPANSLVHLRLGGRAGGGVALGDIGVRITPVGIDGDAPGIVAGDKMFYGNAARDTDLAALALPGGVELYAQMRSAAAPERLAFAVDLPRGARLREDLGSGAIAIVRAGRTLAHLVPPRAWDADRRAVPVRYDLRGDTVVVAVDHRRPGTRYPVVVDPAVIESFRSWRGDPNMDYSGWNYEPDSLNKIKVWYGDWYLGRGLYLYNRTSTESYVGTEHRRWHFNVLGFGDAFIYRADFTDMVHEPNSTCATEGIFSRRNNAYESGAYKEQCFGYSDYRTHTVCSRSDCQPTDSAGTPSATTGNAAMFGVKTPSLGLRPSFTAYAGGAAIYQYDVVKPLMAASGIPSTWVQSASGMKVRGTDTGMGMSNVRVVSPDRTDWDQSPYKEPIPGCYDRKKRCAKIVETDAFTTGNLPEGIVRIRGIGTDIIGDSTTTDFPLKLDRSAPDLSVVGGLRSHAGLVISEAAYGLRAVAKDGSTASALTQRSGVKRLQILVDGVVVAGEDADCTAGNCEKVAEYELRTQDFAAGRHTIKVVATDQVGNEKIDEWVVHVDHAAGARDSYSFTDEAVTTTTSAHVNLGNGNLLFRARDFAGGSTGPELALARSYNSRVARVRGGLFGNGWSLDGGTDVRLAADADGVVRFTGPSGYVASFQPSGAGFTQPRGLSAALRRLDDGRYELEFVDTGDLYRFDANGRLESILDEDAGSVYFEHDGAGRLTRMRNDDGDEVTFVLDGAGRVERATTPEGTHRFTYDDAGNLTSHADPAERATTYGYDGSNRLTRVTPPGENPLSVGYDERGQVTFLRRVTDSSAGTGPTTAFTFGAGVATVTPPGGVVQTHHHDETLFVTQASVGSGPSIALSGTLHERAEQQLDRGTAYGLTVTANDGNAGVDSLDVNVDTAVELAVDDACAGSCTASRSLSVDPADYESGEYVVEAFADDGDERWTRRRFIVRIPAAPAPSSASTEEDPDVSTNSRRFRADFGLRSDEAYLDSVNADPANRARATEYGVPLTAAELADIQAREDVQGALHIVKNYVTQHALGSSFAGTWTDHPNGGIVYVGFTADAQAHVDAIKQLFPYPTRLRAFTAERSRSSLDATHEQIRNDLELLRSLMIDVRSIVTMNQGNTVEVGVRGLNAVEATQLRLRYGDWIQPYEDDPGDHSSRGDLHRRIYPGLRIEADEPRGPDCTAAYSARSLVRRRGGGYVYSTSTAGHCGGENDVVWHQGGRRIGHTTASQYKSRARANSKAPIQLDVQVISSNRRRVGKRIWGPDFRRTLIAVETPAVSEHEGNVVCITGEETGNSCGELKTTNATKTSKDGVELIQQRLATYDADGGDSGAAIYRKARGRRAIAVGLHQGWIRRTEDAFAKRHVYGHVRFLESIYNLRVCVQGLCG